MNSQYVENQVQGIRTEIKRARFEDALSLLENFIQQIGDKELDKQIITLTARYNVDIKEKLIGIKDKDNELNKLINALTQILGEAKEIALEKITLKATNELEKLNERGTDAVDKLEKLNKLMAESRLLEIEITSMTFGRFFNPDQQKRMEDHIKRFKELLN
jgi:DNA-directed RNA polymerase beta subunit